MRRQKQAVTAGLIVVGVESQQGRKRERERERETQFSRLEQPRLSREEGEVSARDGEGSSSPATCTVIVLYSVTRITAGKGMQMRKPKNWLPKKRKKKRESRAANIKVCKGARRDFHNKRLRHSQRLN